MPFAIHDPLIYKRNDRQQREIHEQEYIKYLADLNRLRSQHNIKPSKSSTISSSPFSAHTSRLLSSMTCLSDRHMVELERNRLRSAATRKSYYNDIEQQNRQIFERLLKASCRTLVDDHNLKYQKQLDTFMSKRLQQRRFDHQKIEYENLLLSKRLMNTQAHITNKREQDRDWKKHMEIMKKTCHYPENIDRFITTVRKTNNGQQENTCNWKQRNERSKSSFNF
ncbi:unnamed protein product [Didymodactylos carnosus]|uniref:Uncharacterized protein n=1 Tax=Didymodactylos carnosus TaxID=1234261 RepID=A0A814FBB4_9BILA|nr:unnamed protein product [Didymodactylos carnosus]CAF3755207.1 unnamed protein product [Didymodactylos carnosus]